MKKSIELKKILMTLCLATLMILAALIVVRVVVRQVLVVHCGIINDFTSFIFFDNVALNQPADYVATIYGETDNYSIDWSEEYPFDNGKKSVPIDEEETDGLLGYYLPTILTFQDKVERYTQDDLAGYTFFTELGKKYDDIIGWNFASFNEYNGVFQMPDGHWTSLKERKDVSEHVASIVSLKDFCDNRGIPFLYIQAPYKISKYDDPDISGVVDFSNQNADDLLNGLAEAQVDTFDLREVIHEEFLVWHDLFYQTDHHWKSTTGLWAAGQIADMLNATYGFNINTAALDASNYYSVEYPEWFLGSYGKKVTLAQTTPDDFKLIYPNFETQLHYVIPSIGIDQTGDFSITYNMEQVEKADYYNKNPYAAYNYGDRAIIQFENLSNDNLEGRNILIVHDSFCDTVIPFLALGVKNIDSIDLRYFTGSLESYINEKKPDIVIIMYNAGELINDIDWNSHTSSFDFR